MSQRRRPSFVWVVVAVSILILPAALARPAHADAFSPLLGNCGYLTNGVLPAGGLYGTCSYAEYYNGCTSGQLGFHSKTTGGPDQTSASATEGNDYTCGYGSSAYTESDSAQGQSDVLTYDIGGTVSGGPGVISVETVDAFWDSLTVTGSCPLSGNPANLGPCVEVDWSVDGSGQVANTPQEGGNPAVNVMLEVFMGSVTYSNGFDFADVNQAQQPCIVGTGCTTSASFTESGTVSYPISLASGETIFWGADINVYGESGSVSATASDPTSLVNLSPSTVTFSVSASQQGSLGSSVPQFPLGFALLIALAIPALLVLRKRAVTLRASVR